MNKQIDLRSTPRRSEARNIGPPASGQASLIEKPVTEFERSGLVVVERTYLFESMRMLTGCYSLPEKPLNYALRVLYETTVAFRSNGVPSTT